MGKPVGGIRRYEILCEIYIYKTTVEFFFIISFIYLFILAAWACGERGFALVLHMGLLIVWVLTAPDSGAQAQ